MSYESLIYNIQDWSLGHFPRDMQVIAKESQSISCGVQ